MQPVEALKHIRTLINVASESDDIDLIYKHLRGMQVIVNKALPREKTKKNAARKRSASSAIQ